ncbi:MAG TPA: hypothetical protein PLQ76_02145 [bacterium]|nr:hypothetical protein [bacterium]
MPTGSKKYFYISPVFLTSVYFLIVIVFFFFGGVFKFFSASYVADNLIYYREHFAVPAAKGLLPYKDVMIEYPPLSAVYLWLLFPFAGSQNAYNGAFICGMTAISISVLLDVFRLTDISSPMIPEKTRRLRTLAGFTFLTIAAGPIALVSLDYIAVALVTKAFLKQAEGKNFSALGLIAAAFCAKGYPILLAPVFIFQALKTGGAYQFKKAIAGLFSFLFILFGLPLILAPGGIFYSFSFHFERGVEKLSIYGAALNTAGLLHLIKLPYKPAFPGWDAGANYYTDFAMHISPWFLSLLLFVAFLCVLGHYSRNNVSSSTTKDTLVSVSVLSATLVISSFMLGFKVASPQFLIWLIPTSVVIYTKARVYRIAVLILAGIGFSAQWLFPWHILSLMQGLDANVIEVLVFKNLLLFIFFMFTLVFTMKVRFSRDQ